jgi:nicotinamide/nicotinate riboside kinase
VTTTASGKLVQDWDTIDALNVSQLASTLSYVRENGHLPPTLKSKEDLNDAGDSGVDTADIQLLRDKVGPRLGRALQTKGEDQSDTAAKAGLSIAFLDGFLLYAPPGDGSHPLSPVRSRIDIPLFLPTTYTLLKQRRESRTGYVTIGPAPTPVVKAAEENAARASATDGGGEEADTSSANGDEPEQDFDPPTQNFWTDPPGYVDDIVWPRYISDHSWLLIPESRRPGNIDELKELVGEGVNVRRDAGVIVAPGNGEASMVELLEWAVEEVVQGIAGLI